jgi:hypothetical protein
MRPDLNDEELLRLHRSDLLREARQIYIAQDAAMAQQGARPPLLWRVYAPPLALLGRWMLSWGERLTRQYGARLRADLPESGA